MAIGSAQAFTKVGFNRRQAAAVQTLGTQTQISLTRTGFNRRQAAILLTQKYVAVTNTTGYTTEILIRQGKFTKAQTTLLMG